MSDIPSCFGTALFQFDAPECQGGYDPLFTQIRGVTPEDLKRFVANADAAALDRLAKGIPSHVMESFLRNPVGTWSALEDQSNESARSAGIRAQKFIAEAIKGPGGYSVSNIRERCEFYQECGQRQGQQKTAQPVEAPRMQLSQPARTAYGPVTPTAPQATHLPVVPTQQQPIQQPPLPPPQRAQVTQMVQQPYAPPQPPAPQYAPQPQYMQYAPQVVMPALQMIPVNHQMPAYLTQLENREDRPFAALGVEVLRSAGKSMGHTIANFFDSVSLLKNK